MVSIGFIICFLARFGLVRHASTSEITPGSSIECAKTFNETCTSSVFCYYSNRYMKTIQYEKLGCDFELKGHQPMYIEMLDKADTPSLCVAYPDGGKMCLCSQSNCNEKWMVGQERRKLTNIEMLILSIAMLITLCSWNMAACCICTVHPQRRREDRKHRSYCCIVACERQGTILITLLQVLMAISLFLFSWYPSSISCVGFHDESAIPQTLFLFQTGQSDTVSIIAVMSLQMLPLIHIPLLLMSLFTKVNIMQSKGTEVLPFVREALMTIAYLLTAVKARQVLTKFEKSLIEECQVNLTMWTVALLHACVMCTICPFSMMITASERYRRLAECKKSKEVTSETSLSTDTLETTASANTAINDSGIEQRREHIEISPQPLVVDRVSGGTLYVRNTRSSDWVAVRVLPSSDLITVFPRKFLLPPNRTAAADVTVTSSEMIPKQCTILIEWFRVGSDCPPCNSELIWKRPHRMPQKQWSHSIICVYFDSETSNSDVIDEKRTIGKL